MCLNCKWQTEILSQKNKQFEALRDSQEHKKDLELFTCIVVLWSKKAAENSLVKMILDILIELLQWFEVI